MSDVVEKLEIALKYQEPVDLIPKEYQEILKAVAPPLIYRSIEELKVLLSKGVLLNGGKMWLSITENREHIERIYIEACLNLDEIRPGSLKHPSGDIVNSRFPGGLCYEDNYLQFEFEYCSTSTSLHVAGIEFQPCEEKVELQVFEEYQEIVEAASQTLVYRSLDELKQILSKGVHLNGYKTWFSLNEKGEHCHMISMKDCLIPNEDFPSQYKSDRRSIIKRGDNTSTVYLENRRDDDRFHMAELYQFTSDGSIVDLEITFENSGTNIDGVEGIMFQPLEIVEDQASKDDKVENIQTISDSESDTYWEQKFPNDYEEILSLSKDSLMCTTKKELYSILRRGFLIDNGQQWFAIDKHGKKCLMLSARATWVIDDKKSACMSPHES
nr:protein kinase-like domain, phloem protein 2-like protein [Tanacetum cinerariifolium]